MIFRLNLYWYCAFKLHFLFSSHFMPAVICCFLYTWFQVSWGNKAFDVDSNQRALLLKRRIKWHWVQTQRGQSRDRGDEKILPAVKGIITQFGHRLLYTRVNHEVESVHNEDWTLPSWFFFCNLSWWWNIYYVPSETCFITAEDGKHNEKLIFHYNICHWKKKGIKNVKTDWKTRNKKMLQYRKNIFTK